jgi:hypothetical protein
MNKNKKKKSKITLDSINNITLIVSQYFSSIKLN